MIISFTGYRSSKLPDKETGYKLPNPTYIKICKDTEKLLLELKPDKCISGMAQGYDLYCANICVKLKIPFVAAVPHIGQELIWPKQSQDIYHKLLSKASEVVIVSEGGYSAAKMHIRNEYLVNNCDALIACIKPNESSGGTFSCCNFAKSINRKIYFVDPTV